MNIITAGQTYATHANAMKKLLTELGARIDTARWLIATTPDGKRFVPVVVGNDYIMLAHRGIMVIS